MAKYVLRGMFAVVFVAVAVHGYLWDKATRELEKMVHDAVVDLDSSVSQYDILASYTLKRAGYPFSAAVVADDFSLEWSPATGGDGTPPMNERYTAMGAFSVSVDLFAPSVAKVSMKNTELVSYVDSVPHGRVHMAAVYGSVTKGGDAPVFFYDLAFDALDFYVRKEEGLALHRAMSINAVSVGADERTKGDLRDFSERLEASGITVFDAETQDAMKVGAAVLDFAVTDLPGLTDEEASVVLSFDEVSPSEGRVAELKEVYKAYLSRMANSGARFQLKALSVQGTDAEVMMSGDMGLLANQSLDGGVSVALSGRKASEFVALLPLPVALAIQEDKGVYKLNMSIRGGVLYFGAAPLFPVPKVPELLDLVPDDVF